MNRRLLQDDGMGAGLNNTITPNKPNRHSETDVWHLEENYKPRHSEPSVNHGEESNRPVILSLT